jgi:hypothetical protein
VHGDAEAFARRLAAYRAAGVDAVRLVPLTSLGAGIDVAYDLIDVLGELCSRVSGPRPRSELRPQRLE